MKNNLSSKKSFGLIASLLATISLLAVAATPVFARPLSPLPVPLIKVPAGNNASSYSDSLSALFAHEKTMFNNLHSGADIRMTSLKDATEVLADAEKFDPNVANFDSQQHRELVEESLARQATAIKATTSRTIRSPARRNRFFIKSPLHPDGTECTRQLPCSECTLRRA